MSGAPTATSPASDGAPTDKARPDGVLLAAPRDGVPPVVDTPAALAATIDRFAAARGALAVDAERASGYRYGQRAYLVQLRRDGAGTALIDPIACPDLSSLNAALSDVEWIVHAASQDLPCLREVGLSPARLFDTELAGRLLGFPRVALGTLCHECLGVRLEKVHSAEDWSRRPLPTPWLTYAALDVELLSELRGVLSAQLESAGKRSWAEAEFHALCADTEPAPPRADPWRRTSGLHSLRSRRELAVAREVWQTRDEIALARDLAPGRVLRDQAIIALAASPPPTLADLRRRPALRKGRADTESWWAAIERARALPESELPSRRGPHPDHPTGNHWERRNPAAARRLSTTRGTVAQVAERHWMPPENLLAPAVIREFAWRPPTRLTPAGIAHELGERGARRWQAELVSPALARALSA